MVDVSLVVHRETDAAWLVSDTGRRAEAQWLARKLATRGLGVTFTVPEWLAREKGWLR